MAIEPKTFNAIIYPRESSAAEFFSKNDPERSNNIDSIVWQSKDPQGFKDDYCFLVMLQQKDNPDDALIEDKDFENTLKEICSYVRRYDWIPASLLIGKKTGDTLTLKNRSIVNLTCANFNSLHRCLYYARVNLPTESGHNPEKEKMLTTRLDELSALVTQHYGEWAQKIAKEDRETIYGPDKDSNRYCDKLISGIVKLLIAIATCFVRLFTCNFSEKTCLDD